MNGGDTIKAYRYRQNWGKYRMAAGSMIRFYLPRSELTDREELSPASAEAWDACDRAFRELSENEKQIVRAYYSETCVQNRTPDPLQRVAESFEMDVSSVRRVVDRIIRAVVIYRGLADE